MLSTGVYDQVVQHHVLCTREAHSNIHRNVLLTPVIAQLDTSSQDLRPALFKMNLNIVLPLSARYPDALSMCTCLSDALLDACYILRSVDPRTFIPHSRSQHVVWGTNYVMFCPIISSLKAANILLSVCFRSTSLHVVTRVLMYV